MSEQTHPQEKRDQEIVDRLLQGAPDPQNLADLARLRIRYQNFPGARALQSDLDRILQQWQLSEADLFAQTRQLHATGRVYRVRTGEEEDWS
ncbi:DUF3288 family protein [Synechocystis sp. LKSZ1]|uniref:DUF3288 family protein n=1 Tax=Synechocystis sp. LKSZ1 TaxID=3144951 RepID=UPI00336BB7F6